MCRRRTNGRGQPEPRRPPWLPLRGSRAHAVALPAPRPTPRARRVMANGATARLNRAPARACAVTRVRLREISPDSQIPIKSLSIDRSGSDPLATSRCSWTLHPSTMPSTPSRATAERSLSLCRRFYRRHGCGDARCSARRRPPPNDGRGRHGRTRARRRSAVRSIFFVRSRATCGSLCLPPPAQSWWYGCVRHTCRFGAETQQRTARVARVSVLRRRLEGRQRPARYCRGASSSFSFSSSSSSAFRRPHTSRRRSRRNRAQIRLAPRASTNPRHGVTATAAAVLLLLFPRSARNRLRAAPSSS